MASSFDDADVLRDHSTDDRPDTSSDDARTISDRSDRTDSSTECQWRTDEHHNQECSRYFDCPTHTIERRLSMDGDEARVGSPRAEADTREATIDTPTSQNSSQPYEHSMARSPSHSGTPELPQQLAAETWDAPEAMAGPNGSMRQLGTPEGQDQGESSQSSWSFAGSQPSSDTTVRTADRPGYDVVRGPVSPFHAPLPPRPTHRSQQLASGPPGYHGHALPPAPRPRPRASSRRPSEAGLPRWVPDAEVTYCPICQTQFSFFVRKHHCR